MPAFKDLSGQRFSRLLVKERGPNKGKHTRFFCVCDCGHTVLVHSDGPVSGNTQSCGCYRDERRAEVNSQTKTKDITNKVFGRLTALRPLDKDRYGYRWLCRCSCGEYTKARLANLMHGNVQSCGCLAREITSIRSIGQTFAIKHGHSPRTGDSSTYSSWSSMMNRCYDPNREAWANYGGCGIKVCERWHKFENFLADMGERPEGTTIGRYADLSNYAPGECCWMTQSEQNLARRNKTAVLRWAAALKGADLAMAA